MRDLIHGAGRLLIPHSSEPRRIVFHFRQVRLPTFNLTIFCGPFGREVFDQFGDRSLLYVFLDFLIDGIHIFGLALLSMKTATATYEMSWVGKVASSVSAPLTRLYDSSYRF